jgi:hypothetical protein
MSNGYRRFFPSGDKAARTWSWPLPSNWFRRQDNMHSFIHSPIRLHGVTLHYLSTGTTLFVPYSMCVRFRHSSCYMAYIVHSPWLLIIDPVGFISYHFLCGCPNKTSYTFLYHFSSFYYGEVLQSIPLPALASQHTICWLYLNVSLHIANKLGNLNKKKICIIHAYYITN